MLSAEPNPENLVPQVVNPQANPTVRTEEGYDFDTTANLPKPLVNFFKGEPEALGATQIFAGVIMLVFGITLMTAVEMEYYELLVPVFFSGLPFWSGIMYITSGSVSVATSLKPTLGKVRACVVLNILSSLAAFCGIIIIMISLAIGYDFHSVDHIYCVYKPNELCKNGFNVKVVKQGVVSILLLFSILMFCITITSSVFGCKTTCRTSFTEVNIVLYQTTSVTAPDTMTEAPYLPIDTLPSTDPIMINGSNTECHEN